jgi:tetratricopeptide (TPR) repeat protein
MRKTVMFMSLARSASTRWRESCYAKAGEREKARAILKQLEANQNVSRAGISTLYVALGEYEQAFVLLERAYEAHDNQLQFLKISPYFDALRSDPRFQDLMRRIGFTQ